MAVLGSILFNRTLKQFLECQDLTSSKGVELVAKLREAAKGSLDRILEAIPASQSPHKEILINICVEEGQSELEAKLLDNLENDTTVIRATAAQVLTKTPNVTATKLFKRLHDADVSKPEVIEVLEHQKKQLKPEQVISNAVKLGDIYGEQLIKLIHGSEVPIDLSALRLEPGKIVNANLKLLILRYLSTVDEEEVAGLIGRFVADKNKTISMEALKCLSKSKVKFDAAILLPNLESMSDMERGLALEILEKQATSALVPRLAAFSCGKSEELRDRLIKIMLAHVNAENLELFLTNLDKQEWWGKDQVVKALQKFGNSQLFKAAATLTEHSSEFVRDTAQQFAAQNMDASAIDKVGATATHETWQVREKAIAALGKSGKRESLTLLKKSLSERPESAVAILKAVADLGFSKGLEIAFQCLRMPEALIQREALVTISALATKHHASAIRDNVIKRVPLLKATVKDTAEEVVNKLTDEFNLTPLSLDSEEFFNTRLVKVEKDDKDELSSTDQPGQEPVNRVAKIEDLKDGDKWMDRYRLKKEIGRGAMGRVLLAEDEMVGEMLILKFMHPELTADSDSMERFMREVKYSRKVSHNNVIRIHDLLSKDGLCAISMEYFESRGVDEILDEIKLFDVKTGLSILYQVSEGMVAAHNQNVIHRDLKPSNILMNDSGLVKVVDFGIASASSNIDSTLTQAGSIIGTPAYLSPERAKGQEASNLCDIYALGVIAYMMFSGDLPYRGETMAILFQHIEGKATPIHQLNESIDPHVSALIHNLMASEASNRIQSMQEVSSTIKGLLEKL